VADTDPWEQLEGLIRKIKRDQTFHLKIWKQATGKKDSKIGEMLSFDRDQPAFEQVRQFLVDKGLRGNTDVRIFIRGSPDFDGGSKQATIELPQPDPPPPPPPPPVVEVRQPNPAAAVAKDPVDELRELRQRQRDIRDALEEDCEECGLPESECECRCDDPPDGCGLPLSECTCEDDADKPSVGKVVEEVFVSEKGRKLLEDAGDEILGILKAFKGRIANPGHAAAATKHTVAKVVTKIKPPGAA
jgi:hypothetical protein